MVRGPAAPHGATRGGGLKGGGAGVEVKMGGGERGDKGEEVGE